MSREIAHITEPQRCALHTRLLGRARELADEIGAGLQPERLRAEPFDPGSDEEAAVGVAAVQRGIEDALARMEIDRYGLCVECGAALPFVRLDAVPEAARCVHCESENERRKARPASL